MNIETLREYCLSLPMTSEDMAFGEEYLLLRVAGKIFACISFMRDEQLTLKCDAEQSILLRERYREIEPAWHWNKKYWNQIDLGGGLDDDFIRALIRHSYAEVVSKLPRRVKSADCEITRVSADIEQFR